MSLGPTISFVIRSIKLCVFPLVSPSLGAAALTLLPKSAEVLHTINDDGLMDTQSDDFTLAIAFTFSLALWSLSNWYASRLLLQRNFDPPCVQPLPPDWFSGSWMSSRTYAC